MNILIVDDEALSVDGIARALPWTKLQIQEVYKAYSMKQAQCVFQSHPIDILLCDIEMPRGSGIELMEWVREKGYHPVCIFLTCYSRFDYASSAVKLQMFDYVLKPCEYENLTKVIEKAVQKRLEDVAKEEKEQLAQFWTEDYQNRVTAFWNELLQGDLPSEEQSLIQEIELHHLNQETVTQLYYLCLLQMVPNQETGIWRDSSWRFAVKNVIAEMVNATTVLLWDKTFIVITAASSYGSFSEYAQNCAKLVQTLSEFVPAAFLGYLSDACTVFNANSTLQLLKQDAHEKFSLQSTVFIHGNRDTPRTGPLFSSERWINALLACKGETIIQDIRHYLSSPAPHSYIDRNLLSMIYHQLLKAVYASLDAHHLSSQQSLLSHTASAPEDTLNSVPAFLSWAEEITDQTVALISEKTQNPSVIDTLIQYIHQHLDSDLNRAELTEVVHLHPDYLSTIFRQKMGISLSDYITRERIQAAKKLLLSTDLPINEIALRTGFQTIPYFSKQFKRFEKVTPVQYRKGKTSS